MLSTYIALSIEGIGQQDYRSFCRQLDTLITKTRAADTLPINYIDLVLGFVQHGNSYSQKLYLQSEIDGAGMAFMHALNGNDLYNRPLCIEMLEMLKTTHDSELLDDTLTVYDSRFKHLVLLHVNDILTLSSQIDA